MRNLTCNKASVLLMGVLASAVSVAGIAAGQTSHTPSAHLFIHTPYTGSGASADQVAADLDKIVDTLEADYRAAHGKMPKVCLFGYVGAWSSTGGAQPNIAGSAANALGNASSTDNRCSFLVEISYCTLEETLKRIIQSKKCDIVIGLGEGGTRGMQLEVHGDPHNPAIPDCNDYTDGVPVCEGPTCTGTDWDDPPETGGSTTTPTRSALVIQTYTGTTTVTPGTGAGGFLCGKFCCGEFCVPEAPQTETHELPLGGH